MTLTLVSFAYYMNLFSLAPAMLLFDTTDIFVGMFKLTVDVSDKTQAIWYILMIISWSYLRLFFLPLFIYDMFV